MKGQEEEGRREGNTGIVEHMTCLIPCMLFISWWFHELPIKWDSSSNDLVDY